MLPFPLISSTSVVCSRSATLDLATALLLRWNRAPTCSGPSVDLIWHLSAPVFASVHPSRCSDHPDMGMEAVVLPPFSAMSVAVFWHCISAGTSTCMSMYYCCETSVICCTFWLVWLMSCNCGNFNGSASCGHGRVDLLHLLDLVSLHTESGES